MNTSFCAILVFIMYAQACTALRGARDETPEMNPELEVSLSKELVEDEIVLEDEVDVVNAEHGRELGTARVKVIFRLRDSVGYCLDWTKTELFNDDKSQELGSITANYGACTTNTIAIKHQYSGVQANAYYRIKLTSKIEAGDKKTKWIRIKAHNDGGDNNFCFRQGGTTLNNNRIDGQNGGSVNKCVGTKTESGWGESGLFGPSCTAEWISCADQPFAE